MKEKYRKTMGVILDRIDGKYYLVFDYDAYEVNEVGARIFDLCNDINEVKDIVDKLAKFYACEVEVIQQDIEDYINQLNEIKAIEKC